MIRGVLVFLSPSHLGLDLLDLNENIVSNLFDAMLKILDRTHLFNSGRHFGDLTRQSKNQ
jgi:hypothetical protein